MSRFLLTTLGSLGDLHPYIAVARSLIEHGQQAVLATSPEYREAIEEAGVEFAPVRPGFAELGDYRSLVIKAFDVRRGPEFLIRELIMPFLHLAYADLRQASTGADFLVSHPLTYALPLVAERRGLPWAATVLSPMSFVSCYDPPTIPALSWFDRFRACRPWLHRLVFALAKAGMRSWEAPLRKLRRQIGLPPSARPAMFEGQFSPLLNLALFDGQLAAPQPDWPRQLRICGAPLFDGVLTDPDPVAELADFLGQGEPPLVFVLGSSVVWLAEDFWQKAIAAAEHLGRRAILITGSLPLKEVPPTLRVFPYLPYSKLFPEASIIIHQAGIGTLAQALRSGQPQLIVPAAFDQPDNARRAVALGLARVLPFREVTVDGLVAELHILLGDCRYREAARLIAGQLAEVDGAGCTAEALIEAARKC